MADFHHRENTLRRGRRRDGGVQRGTTAGEKEVAGDMSPKRRNGQDGRESIDMHIIVAVGLAQEHQIAASARGLHKV